MELELVHEGSVACLTIDRPSTRNALNSRVITELDQALQRLAADDSVRVLVITGSTPGFCSGSDLKEIAGMSVPEMAAHEARTGQFVRSLQHVGKPVIAAVEGFAVGGGFLLATGCDLVVTADDAQWHLPEVALGWVPPWGLQSLVARVGPVTARRLAWGDQPLSGSQLHGLGVADEVADPGKALERATKLAARLAALSPDAVASTKRALSDAVIGPAETLDSRTTRLFFQDCQRVAEQHSLNKFARKPQEEYS